MTLYTHQTSNVRKTWFLMTGFFIVVVAIGWVFAQVWADSSILYIAIIFSILMNFFSYWYSDKIVVKMSGAKPANREEFFDLWTSVENLSITAGLPMPKVYVINDSAPNAFATGRNAEHAVVAVTMGLLSVLNKTELEGVIAHELSHIGNKDMLLSTVAVVLVGFVSILSDIFLRSGLRNGGGGRDRGKAGGVIMIVGLVLAILAPIVATLIHLAISRKREFLADASGALLTRYPEGLASALQKISEYGAPMQKASNATAHLFIANPFGSKAGVISKMFMTHPPVGDRINALLGHPR